jgi:TolB-like protein
VKRSGNRVRITAKLINAGDGFQVWASENMDREVKDSLALQKPRGMMADYRSGFTPR